MNVGHPLARNAVLKWLCARDVLDRSGDAVIFARMLQGVGILKIKSFLIRAKWHIGKHLNFCFTEIIAQ